MTWRCRGQDRCFGRKPECNFSHVFPQINGPKWAGPPVKHDALSNLILHRPDCLAPIRAASKCFPTSLDSCLFWTDKDLPCSSKRKLATSAPYSLLPQSNPCSPALSATSNDETLIEPGKTALESVPLFPDGVAPPREDNSHFVEGKIYLPRAFV
ncbi:hypothetical protein KM043_005141 [Ampulex compressa]|nr:hypothetical protein KM043_005141 [Ampulex compressa]